LFLVAWAVEVAGVEGTQKRTKEVRRLRIRILLMISQPLAGVEEGTILSISPRIFGRDGSGLDEIKLTSLFLHISVIEAEILQ
jgi:hypothetical protein